MCTRPCDDFRSIPHDKASNVFAASCLTPAANADAQAESWSSEHLLFRLWPPEHSDAAPHLQLGSQVKQQHLLVSLEGVRARASYTVQDWCRQAQQQVAEDGRSLWQRYY